LKEIGIAFGIHRWIIGTVCIACVLVGFSGCHHTKSPPPVPVPAVKPLFTDIAEQAGVRFLHRTGKGVGATIVETTGTGCAVFDYDNDGWLDIFLVNGKSPPGDGNHLYHNNHDGTFTDVTAQAGVAGLGHGVGMGVAVGDYDGDGYLDLYVTYYGKNILYHNEGNGTFTDVTERAGVGGGGFSTAAAFADLDGDGRPDLYVARYCQFDARSKQLCNTHGVPGSCPPYFYTPEPDLVYKNRGDGTFRPVAKEWGLSESTGRGLGIVTVDYDRDGRLDLFVANDGTPNFLYHNLGNGRFESVAAPLGVALTDTGQAVSNMGCDFGDFMGDGNFGCVTGTFEGEDIAIWKYRSGTGFQYISRQTGLNEIKRPLLTFGVGFADMNNDGLLDLFLANGHVQDRVQEMHKDGRYAQPRTFFQNLGNGKFQDRSREGGPAVTTPAVGRGLAFGDLFNDGGIAMVVNNDDGKAMVLRNDFPRQNWVELRLLAKGRNWEAIGAVAELYTGTRKLTRFVHTCYSYSSANDPRLHFGLGKETAVDRVVITWPGGHKSEHRNIPINRISTLLEPGAQPVKPLRRLLETR
jgi:hypothetical protein